MKRKHRNITAERHVRSVEKRARRKAAKLQQRAGLVPPPKWSDAMRRQPRRVQIATYQCHQRYGAPSHATKALRIRAGKR